MEHKEAVTETDPSRSVHVDVLSYVARTSASRLQRLVEEDALGQLIPIWEMKPGWTTPAEFLLTFVALTDIRTRVWNLGATLDRVAIASETVLSETLPSELPMLPQDPVPWRGEHDLNLLNRLVDDSKASLGQIVDRDLFRQLIPLWRQPGWTTPAEYFLVHSAVLDLRSQLNSLERQIEGLVLGASLVETKG